MNANELKRKDMIEAAARVVCARLKRQGLKQTWRPVLDFLDRFDNPDSEEAKNAAVEHFLAIASAIALTSNEIGLATSTDEDRTNSTPVETSVFDNDATPRAVVHRSTGLATAAPTNQTDLIKKEATNLGLTLTENDIQAIGADLEARHGHLCTETALIVDALKHWVALLEKQTYKELDQLHAGLAETISTSHSRLAAKVSDIFTSAKEQQQQYAVAQSTELEKIKSFFASKGVSIAQS